MDQQKKLYRSRTNRTIAGVCGGLGDYFNIDPTIVRLAAVFLTLWWGGGLLLYFIAWFLIPEEPAPAEETAEPLLLSDKDEKNSRQRPDSEIGDSSVVITPSE